jgi:hypothetical protein
MVFGLGFCAFFWALVVAVCGATAEIPHTACPDEELNREDTPTANLARAGMRPDSLATMQTVICSQIILKV